MLQLESMLGACLLLLASSNLLLVVHVSPAHHHRTDNTERKKIWPACLGSVSFALETSACVRASLQSNRSKMEARTDS